MTLIILSFSPTFHVKMKIENRQIPLPHLSQTYLEQRMNREHLCSLGGEGWLGFPDLWSGQKPWWNWYLTPRGEFLRSPEGPASQIHSPHVHDGVPGIFLGLFRWKRESGVRKLRWSYRIYSNPGKNCSLGSWVCGGRPALGRTAA